MTVSAKAEPTPATKLPYNFTSKATMTKQFPDWDAAWEYANTILDEKQKEERVSQFQIYHNPEQYRYDRVTGEKTSEISRPGIWTVTITLAMGETGEGDYYW